MQRRTGITGRSRFSTGRAGRFRTTGMTVAATVALSAVAVACGGGSGGDGSAAEPVLSATAVEGKQLAVSKGCASCHVFYGKDAAGPTWKGLYNSEVTLTDGSVVVADEEYLTRSIKDPWAQKVKGFGTIMPRNNLTDAEVALVVAYIKELNPATG